MTTTQDALYAYRPSHDHEAAIRLVAASGRSRTFRLLPADTVADKVTRLARAYVGVRFYLVRKGESIELFPNGS